MSIHKECDFCGRRFDGTDNYQDMSVAFTRRGAVGEGTTRKLDACTACGPKVERFLQEMTGHDECGRPLKAGDRQWVQSETAASTRTRYRKPGK